MHNFRELKIWQRSMDLAEVVYRTVNSFPKEEIYGLSSQLRRCIVSIPSNIAEGAGRGTNKQFKQFIQISMGSCNEVETQLELAYRFNYITKDVLDTIISETRQVYKMMQSFHNSLKFD